MRLRTATSLLLPLLLAASGAMASESVGTDQQIAGALQAAPEDRREGATVMGYSTEGNLVTLREGTNELICLADKPGDDKFRVACYHESLEAYMERGRELRAEGIEGADNLQVRHDEADAGKLQMPSAPAALYNLGGSIEIFNATTGEVSGGRWVWSIYTPYASEEATGLPTTPQAPGAPWIMRPSTASSHIMVVQPSDENPKESKE